MKTERKGHIYAVGNDEKCGCCNCFTYKTFLVAESEEGVQEAYEENNRGLCGGCLVEMLMNNEATIIGGW